MEKKGEWKRMGNGEGRWNAYVGMKKRGGIEAGVMEKGGGMEKESRMEKKGEWRRGLEWRRWNGEG